MEFRISWNQLWYALVQWSNSGRSMTSTAVSQSISFVFPFSPTFPSKIHTFPARFGATYDCGENPRKETERKRITMKNSNELNVPQAREAMDKFKMQAAQDVDGPVTYWTIIESSKIIQINGWFPNLL